MIDVPEIIEQGKGKIILKLCEKYNIPTINKDGTFLPLIKHIEESIIRDL